MRNDAEAEGRTGCKDPQSEKAQMRWPARTSRMQTQSGAWPYETPTAAKKIREVQYGEDQPGAGGAR